MKGSKYASRCPCLKLSKPCSSKCRCIDCDNEKKPAEAPLTGCRCNNINNVENTCVGSEKRKSRCKCFKAKVSCTIMCKCVCCRNTFGKNTNSLRKSKTNGKLRAEKTYKRKRTSHFLKDNDFALDQGTWTSLETIAIFCCGEVNVTDGNHDVEDIYILYNLISGQFTNEIRAKTKNQIKAKIDYMKRNS